MRKLRFTGKEHKRTGECKYCGKRFLYKYQVGTRSMRTVCDNCFEKVIGIMKEKVSGITILK